MTGIICVQTSHSLSRSYLNHLVQDRSSTCVTRLRDEGKQDRGSVVGEVRTFLFATTPIGYRRRDNHLSPSTAENYEQVELYLHNKNTFRVQPITLHTPYFYTQTHSVMCTVSRFTDSRKQNAPDVHNYLSTREKTWSTDPLWQLGFVLDDVGSFFDSDISFSAPLTRPHLMTKQWLFPWRQSGRSVTLPTHLHLMPRVRMCRSTHLPFLFLNEIVFN
jgi:hypothetical protein